MRKFTVRNEEKWMHQNKAEYTGAYVEGNLIDNSILACKRGYCAVYERHVNEWTSEHVFKFVPYKDFKGVDELFAEFMDFEESVHLAWWLNELAYAAREKESA